MPIAPIDLQQLYMQQSYVGSIEHFKMAAKSATVQSEDKDINKDSYEKDSTVVKSENVGQDKKVQDREENSRNKNDFNFLSYRKRKRKIIVDDKEEEIVEVIAFEDESRAKGKKIDVLG